MKRILILFCLFCLFSCKSKKAVIEKSIVIVNLSDVDVAKKNRAYDVGQRLLETCNTSRFRPFSKEEATEKVIQNATIERISATCKKINIRNGRFLSLNLIDVMHDEVNDQYIFRYNIRYEKKYFKRELTVVVDPDNRVSAISTKEVKPKPL
ncbi:hypothetical protein [Flavobacterium humi]|uniref:Penicillin-binding protein activator LpoB n=1 Tax=Flavobacterium humi TaxID=2562683 RepID=A0A4Z0LCH2_9FLAO|nr:hypothetical protein [Flavobacterium humi]TGD59555.1 hypothetical protein E4635_01060 [Flavobacterium humi]